MVGSFGNIAGFEKGKLDRFMSDGTHLTYTAQVVSLPINVLNVLAFSTSVFISIFTEVTNDNSFECKIYEEVKRYGASSKSMYGIGRKISLFASVCETCSLSCCRICVVIGIAIMCLKIKSEQWPRASTSQAS
ncbi:hypothetical protein Tco_0653522 [Tanacetum coccineum]|uniref:Uncharacterized protein n=1 Tax=Tanacetum coccineum TaxID=301880 RepID=A0ABQ4X0M4_9ASTR